MLTKQMSMSGVLKIGIVIAVFFAGKSYGQPSDENLNRKHPVPKIEGYGPYKFGMSIEQAMKARPVAKRIEGNCGYKMDLAYCLSETAKLFGQDAEINAQFDKNTKKLSRIIITFERVEGKKNEKACRKVWQTILWPLIQKWGEPTRHESNTSHYWESPYGGQLGLEVLCVNDDYGVVLVTYEDTPAF